MAESNGLLNRRRDNPLPRVRIPPSPPVSLGISHFFAFLGHSSGFFRLRDMVPRGRQWNKLFLSFRRDRRGTPILLARHLDEEAGGAFGEVGGEAPLVVQRELLVGERIINHS